MDFITFLQPVLLVLPAILTGAFIAHNNAVSFLAYVPNLGAVLLGILILALINSKSKFLARNTFAWSLGALFIIFLSLFSTGLESVHRWVAVGPIFLNVSMAFAPILIYGVAYSKGLRPLLLSIPLSILYILQPDAGQATAFSLAATIVFLANRRLDRIVRIAGTIAMFSLTAIAWQMADPLLPVDHVERILHLAFEQGILTFSMSVISILLLCLPFLKTYLGKPNGSYSILSLSFLSYFLMSYLVTELGHFPVPVIGAGAAPVIGWFFMFGLLNNSDH